MRGYFGHLFVYYCCLDFSLPRAQIVIPKLSHTPGLSSPTGTCITRTRALFITHHIHIYALLVPMPVFSPQSRDELECALNDCLRGSSKRKCPRLYGPIGKWDLSQVTDMSNLFYYRDSFNSDLSIWDVSRVTDMRGMFADASTFRQTLCSAAWVNSKASKVGMFTHSLGSISDTVCGTWWMHW